LVRRLDDFLLDLFRFPEFGVPLCRWKEGDMRLLSACALVGVLTLAACDGGGGASSSTSATSTEPTSTSPVSTSPTTSSTTTSSTTSTTTTTSTTVPIEVTVKAQVAADYERAYLRLWDSYQHPTLDGLDAVTAEVAVPDSERAAAFQAFIKNLVANGDVYAVETATATVEAVKLVGKAPYTEAIVTVCEVENFKQVTPAANSPTGSEALVGGSERHEAFRTDEPVRLTDQGWRQYRTRRDGRIFEGADACPTA
jgi:hypothetical protein